MKIAVTGKGGSGKTTVAGALARCLADRGERVVAIDADPNPNLGVALGVAAADVEDMPSILTELLASGHTHDQPAPEPDELLSRYGVRVTDGLQLVCTGKIERPTDACLCCGSHSTTRRFFGDLPAGERVVIADLEAGLNDLIWAHPGADDVVVAVAEPSAKSVDIAARAVQLARTMGVARIVAVANRCQETDDADRLSRATGSGTATIPEDPVVAAADQRGVAAYDIDPDSPAMVAPAISQTRFSQQCRPDTLLDLRKRRRRRGRRRKKGTSVGNNSARPAQHRGGGRRTSVPAPRCGRLLLVGVLVGAVAGGLVWGSLPVGAEDGAGAEAGPAVKAAVQVTQNPDAGRAHSSPQLARNPTNGELAIVETETRNDRGCQIHLSVDEGRSWFRGGDPMTEPWTECSGKPINGPYATLAFDQEGVLYVAFYANDPEYRDAEMIPLHIFLARSEDGGRTFETTFVHESPEPVEEDVGLHNNDRPMVAVDQNDPENVYVGWMQRGAEGEVSGRAMMAASIDGGETFEDPIEVSDERGGYQPRPAVDPDGTVHVLYHTGLDVAGEDEDPFEVPRPVLHRRSEDRGETWSEHVEVDEGNASFYGNRKHVLQAHHQTGDLYAAWYANDDPVFDPNEEDVDIFLRISRDGGETWEDRIVLNDDEDGERVNQYNPGVSIAPNGRIDVAWYDFRNSPYPERFPEEFTAPFNHDGFQDVYYTYSTDDGQTWAPNVRITDRIINREIGVWSNNVHSHMSVGVASSGEGAFFAWQDTRNGDADNQSEDVYFSSAWHGEPAAERSDLSPWLMLGAGALLGMGIAMAISAVLMRRSPRT